MRGRTTLGPRNSAEAVALLVAAVLGVAAVVTAVQAEASSPLTSRPVASDLQPHHRVGPLHEVGRPGGARDAVAVLGRVPASTDAPLASADTGTGAATITKTRSSDYPVDGEVPVVMVDSWLGGAQAAPPAAPSPATTPPIETTTTPTPAPAPAPSSPAPTPSPTTPSPTPTPTTTTPPAPTPTPTPTSTPTPTTTAPLTTTVVTTQPAPSPTVELSPSLPATAE